MWRIAASSLRRTLILIACGILSFTACADRNPLFLRPRLILGQLAPGVMILDLPLDTSADGKWMLFARRDTAGIPQGIFIQAIHPDSSARFVMPIDRYFLNPSEPRFSPDARKLAMIQRDSTGSVRVHVYDIESRADVAVTPTQYFATSPDWDPTGRYIVYDRPWSSYDAPDSAAGIHIVDLTTFQERPLRHGSSMTYGGRPRWSTDGSWIAFWYGTRLGSGDRPPMAIHIYRVRPDGTGYADLTAAFTSDHYDPTWTHGGEGLLFEVFEQHSGLSNTCAASSDGSNRQAWPVDLIGKADVVVTRDGSHAIFTGEDSSGRFGVLYIQGSDDVEGASRIQLTFPPSGLMAQSE